MFKKILFVALFLSFSSYAQNKIKGSRNVTTEQNEIEAFTSIQLDGDFEVGLLKGSRSMVEVEADDNLHDVIDIKVSNNVLYINTDTKITSSKSKKINITFSDSLKMITIDGKITFETLQELNVGDFEFIGKGRSKSKINVSANSFYFNNSGNAKVEASITSEEISLLLRESSDLEGFLKTEVLNVEAMDNASAKIKGETKTLALNASKSSKFNGEKLASKEAEVFTQDNSKNSINVSKKLKLSAKDKSEVDLYNTPEIDLVEFSDKAVLSKKS